MELIECVTCGSHSFTNGKCDYCGNQYESTKFYADDNEVKEAYGKTWCDDGTEAYAKCFHEYTNRTEVTELSFNYLVRYLCIHSTAIFNNYLWFDNLGMWKSL